MHKRIACVLLSLALAMSVVGCVPFSASGKREATYFDVFDTTAQITAYGVSAAEFSRGEQRLHALLQEYHRLYDIYHAYEGVANLYTVNAAAGTPVAVDDKILDLLEYGLEMEQRTAGRVNIVFGAVLALWHDCRDAALENPDAAALPDPAALTAAAAHTDPAALVIDRQAGTVCLTDPDARLDVGAIAKGYVTERAAEFVAQELGWSHVLLNIGGNVRAVGAKPGDAPFTIGIRNPDTDSAVAYLLTVRVADKAVVTSGDYERYYTVAGQRYAHIIDVDTLYPAAHLRAVSVICADSGLADVLSTALFTLPMEQGLRLLAAFPDAAAVFLLPDGSRQYSPGFEDYVLSET